MAAIFLGLNVVNDYQSSCQALLKEVNRPTLCVSRKKNITTKIFKCVKHFSSSFLKQTCVQVSRAALWIKTRVQIYSTNCSHHKLCDNILKWRVDRYEDLE